MGDSEPVSRRRALRLAATAAVAYGLAGCASGGAGGPAGNVSPAPGATPIPAAPAGPDWASLRARLPGGLVLPPDPGYDAARRSFNVRFDDRRPAAVARCAGPQDVQACVELAAAKRIPVAARSGGHSYAGYSTPEAGLVVDLAGLSDVAVDGRQVTVGAGARLIDVYRGVAAAGRCLPAGSCPTVGIAGLTLGGGIGVLARRFGLTCDQLVSAQVVTADSRLVTASAETEPDLFWALRGGGGGNLGIVTSFTFRTRPAPRLALFTLQFPPGSAAALLGAWPQWVASAPAELWSTCVLSGGQPPGCRVSGCFTGPASTLDGPLGDLVRAASVTPTGRFTQDLGYLDAMRYLAGCGKLSDAQCAPRSAGGQLGRESFAAASRMLSGPLDDPDRLVALLDGRLGTDVLLDSLGGAVSDVAPTATAFPHRTALASVQVYATIGSGLTPQRADRSVAEVRDGFGAASGAVGYVNYIDPTMPNWPRAYYGDNLTRLRQVAARYDPDALFGFAQGLTNA